MKLALYSLIMNTRKAQGLLFQKTEQRKPPLITKCSPFMKGNLAEYQYLRSILICKCKQMQAIVKMCNSSCFLFFFSHLFTSDYIDRNSL